MPQIYEIVILVFEYQNQDLIDTAGNVWYNALTLEKRKFEEDRNNEDGCPKWDRNLPGCH